MDVTRAYLQNYVQSGVTKTMNWYLISALYPVESYYDITVGVASNPLERGVHHQPRTLGLRAHHSVRAAGLALRGQCVRDPERRRGLRDFAFAQQG